MPNSGAINPNFNAREEFRWICGIPIVYLVELIRRARNLKTVQSCIGQKLLVDCAVLLIGASVAHNEVGSTFQHEVARGALVVLKTLENEKHRMIDIRPACIEVFDRKRTSYFEHA